MRLKSINPFIASSLVIFKRRWPGSYLIKVSYKISEEKVVWRPDFLRPGKLRSINPATVATDLKVLFIKALPESHLSRPNSISSELNSSVGFSTFLSPHRRVA